MTVVTRFPPSPTGYMHVGTARTAIFNWLYARKHGGKMLFRIEDTDRTRHSDDAVQALIRGIEWLGLDWDGEIVSQFENKERHAKIAQQLLDAGKAYKCFTPAEELQLMRDKGQAYDRKWRDIPKEDHPTDTPFVIRIKAPLEGQTTLSDEILSDITVAHDQLDDFIILRSDNTPTYMLSVVVDDHDMGVTHVIRGDDHVSNTFRQKVIYDALNWEFPSHAHLPLIHGPDGKKLSKRHGATSVELYKDMGYLPEALFNYLLRLGWSHGDDEIISKEQALAWFGLDHVGKSPARFDFDKLENLNAHYIKDLSSDKFCALVIEMWEKKNTHNITDTAKKQLSKLSEELKSRAKTIVQASEEANFLLFNETYPIQDDATSHINSDSIEILKKILESCSEIQETAFLEDEIKAMCKSVAKEHADGKMGKVGMPLRVALTGTTQSPSVFACAEVLGKDEVVRRLNYCIETY